MRLWGELTHNMKLAARHLGWDEAMWDAGHMPERVCKHWPFLDQKEQSAASYLG